ncbi:hypothetical protein [Bifidobacterium myosotis]|uniref:Uncharacterized protein n=1 Tax=Bifidobacterium myosotis TaxID=1630166 RepID=A0A5M9ZKT4_9BIFI|nr:hypothetical protein [Bifidobacterium myosotis]KAA8828200.1 hypothetical protein EMO91_07120 [Bifidobacterium myosotis]
MVTDIHGMSHKPKGTPDGGQYEGGRGSGGGDDIEPPTGGGVAAAAPSGGDGGGDPEETLRRIAEPLRRAAVADRMDSKSAKETAGLLSEADRIEFGPEGAVLYRGDELVFRETNLTPHLDADTMRADPRVRAGVRAAFRADLSELPAAERRSTIRMANRYASAYDRRVCIDSGPNRRYMPASTIANSLRRRTDRKGALEIMKQLHYEDANASANVIRAGFPDDRESAFAFINYTKIRRQPKDVVDKKTGRLLARRGDPIRGEWRDRDGKRKEGVMPEPRGAAGRAYLRMLYSPNDGTPTRRECDRMIHVFKRMDDPEIQARAFHNLCYGNPAKGDEWDDVNFEVGLIGQRKTDREGAALVARFSDRERGGGNAARMIAYRKGLSREAAVAFLAMEPRDDAPAHTQFTRRRRNRATGAMEDVRPRRLTELRGQLHALYQISDRDVEDWRSTHPIIGEPPKPDPYEY